MNNLIEKFEESLISLNKKRVEQIYTDATKTLSPILFIESIVVPALEKIGNDWLLGTVALSQVFMSGILCEELIKEILPDNNSISNNQPNMAICVLNDYHLLGKRVVYSALKASGFSLYDFGTVEPDQLVKFIIDKDIEILLISTLMLHSALKIKDVTHKLKQLKSNTKIVVGGAPFTFDDKLWIEVGADAVGKTASDAVHIIKELSS